MNDRRSTIDYLPARRGAPELPIGISNQRRRRLHDADRFGTPFAEFTPADSVPPQRRRDRAIRGVFATLSSREIGTREGDVRGEIGLSPRFAPRSGPS